MLHGLIPRPFDLRQFLPEFAIATKLAFDEILYCLGYAALAVVYTAHCQLFPSGWTADDSVSYASPVRVLEHIKKARRLPRLPALANDAAQGLAPMAGRTATLDSLKSRLRCSGCGAKGRCTVVAIADPRSRGIPKSPRRLAGGRSISPGTSVLLASGGALRKMYIPQRSQRADTGCVAKDGGHQ